MTSSDIFIGPIVRRSDISQIVIQIAYFKYFNLRFSVRKRGEKEWIGHDMYPKFMQVAPNLYMYYGLIKPIGGGKFPISTLLEYSIAVVDENGENPDYEFFEKIASKDTITYNNDKLPTLFLQAPTQKLNVLYGSCRKIHDDNESKIDALYIGDDLIAQGYEDLGERPVALCLGGDQIYADDVHPIVLTECMNIATKKFGITSEDIGISEPLPPIDKRDSFVKKYANFTSGEAKNHLITFGEYMAIYGLMWNVNNWSKIYPELTHFTDTLKKVRRLLANVATYMIFDDHDITDDWNLSLEWRRKVLATYLGTQIMANGLAAFWLCQGLGNDPQRYTEQEVNEIGMRILNKNKTLDYKKNNIAFARTMFGLQKWEFFTPTYPFIYFLDTRTQRGHRDMAKTNEGAPAFLKSMDSWSETIKNISKLLKNQKSSTPLILVAPAPVFGFSLIDDLQRGVSNLIGPYALDFEGWSANRDHLIAFLSLLGDRNVIILSGDVHYGFTSTVKFGTFDDKYFRGALKGLKGLKTNTILSGDKPTYNLLYESKIIQLTSSALKNFASNVAVKFPANKTPSNSGLFLTETSFKVGKYENGKTFEFGLIDYNEIDKNELKPSCLITQRINNNHNSPYIGDRNIGFLSVKDLDVKNCFYTKSGKQHERNWNFLNDTYWK